MGCQIPWMRDVQCVLKPYDGTKPWVVKYHGWERVDSPFNAFMMNERWWPLNLMHLCLTHPNSDHMPPEIGIKRFLFYGATWRVWTSHLSL